MAFLRRILSRILLALIGASSLTAQIQKQEWLSIPISINLKTSDFTAFQGLQVGIHYNSHAFGLRFAGEFKKLNGAALFYRRYIPGTRKPFRPFFTVAVEKNILRRQLSTGTEVFDVKHKSAWLGLGMEFPLFKSFQVYGIIGLGLESTNAIGIKHQNTSFAEVIDLGITYDLLLRGRRDTAMMLPPNSRKKLRIFFCSRIGVWPTSDVESRFNLYPQLELRIGRVLRPYITSFHGNIERGLYSKEVRPFGFKGLGAGLRLASVQKGRMAFIPDLSYIYAKNQDWTFDNSRFILGNTFSYEIAPGLELQSGIYLHIQKRSTDREFSLGINLHPRFS